MEHGGSSDRMKNVAVALLMEGLVACSSSLQPERIAADHCEKNKAAAITAGEANDPVDVKITPEIGQTVAADKAVSTGG